MSSFARLLSALLLVAFCAPAQEAEAPLVSIKPFSAIAVASEHTAAGAVRSSNESRLSAEVSARIERIAVDVGDSVNKGAVLVEFDRRDYELALARAQAGLRAAEARAALAVQQLQRARQLHQDKFVAHDALTQRETELAVVEAEVALARTQHAQAHRDLTKCTLRAPFRAVVVERVAHEGELATPGAPLLKLIDLGRLYVAAQVQVKDVDALERALRIEFVHQGGRVPLKLTRVSPAINAEARLRDARLAFTGAAVAAGTEGRLVWREHAAQLPPELLSLRDGKLGVFVEHSGKAKFLPLPSAQEGRPAPFPHAADSLVIVDGFKQLRDGQKISRRK